jgi:hypothetical protein
VVGGGEGGCEGRYGRREREKGRTKEGREEVGSMACYERRMDVVRMIVTVGLSG